MKQPIQQSDSTVFVAFVCPLQIGVLTQIGPKSSIDLSSKESLLIASMELVVIQSYETWSIITNSRTLEYVWMYQNLESPSDLGGLIHIHPSDLDLHHISS